jgi:glycosyltransferase involved in cell wall biosynthesis
VTNETKKGPVAYIVSSFPVLSETFVLYDALEMERIGVSIYIYPLLRRRQKIAHSEVSHLQAPVLDLPLITLPILKAQFFYIFRQPGKYLRILYEVLSGSLGSLRFFLGALVFFPKAVFFARNMQMNGIMHIHAHFANHPTTAAYIISRFTGIPFSFSARGSDIHKDRTMLKLKLKAAQFAIAVSAHNRAVMIDTCGKAAGDKIHVIFGGVDTARFPPRLVPRNAGATRIICVARFEAVKGHRCLLRACRLLLERGIEFECRLIGEGPLHAGVEAEIKRLGLSEKISLLGPCSQKQVGDALTQADIAVLASVPTPRGECEGIPNVLKEAMAAGLPVIASDFGGIPELVENGKSGILVKPGDVTALANALARLAADPQLREIMGDEGQRRVVAEFDLRSSTRKRASLFLSESMNS